MTGYTRITKEEYYKIGGMASALVFKRKDANGQVSYWFVDEPFVFNDGYLFVN